MITKFGQFLLEAISLSHAKEYTKIWKASGMESYLNAEFKGKYRIYIPIQNIAKTKDYIETKKDVEAVLTQNKYEIVNYYQNQCKKSSDKNITKITKTLTKLKRDDLTHTYNEHLQQFETFVTSGYDDLTVVISRHPIDIAGMSTGRAWKSCMNLEDGINRQFVEQDIKAGTIIAYLVTSEDTNIENPLSRILIKPFTNGDDVYLFPEKVYGKPNQKFNEIVEEWLLDIQGEVPAGIYNLNKDLYNDSTNVKVLGGEEISKIRTQLTNLLLDDYLEKIDAKTLTVTINSKHQGIQVALYQYGKFPFKIDTVTSKSFTVFDFESFENFPNVIYGDFRVYPKESKDLVGITQNIVGDFSLNGGDAIELSLVGFPKYIEGDCNIENCNTKLFDLDEMKKSNILGMLYFDKIVLEDLSFIPDSVDTIHIENSLVYSTKGISDSNLKKVTFKDVRKFRDFKDLDKKHFDKIVFDNCSLTPTQINYLENFIKNVEILSSN